MYSVLRPHAAMWHTQARRWVRTGTQTLQPQSCAHSSSTCGHCMLLGPPFCPGAPPPRYAATHTRLLPFLACSQLMGSHLQVWGHLHRVTREGA